MLEFTSHGYDGFVFDENDRRVDFKGYRADCINDMALEFLDGYTGEKPFFLEQGPAGAAHRLGREGVVKLHALPGQGVQIGRDIQGLASSDFRYAGLGPAEAGAPPGAHSPGAGAGQHDGDEFPPGPADLQRKPQDLFQPTEPCPNSSGCLDMFFAVL